MSIPNRDREEATPGDPPTTPASHPRLPLDSLKPQVHPPRRASGLRPHYASLAEAPLPYRRIAEARAKTLDQWLERARALGVKLRQAVDPDCGVSASTLWTWKRLYAARGLVGLLPRWQGPAPAIPDEAWHIFRAIYLDQNRPSVRFGYERMLTIYAAGGGDAAAVPSVSAFRRRVKSEPEAAMLLFREGGKRYYDAAEPFLSRNYDDVPAGDCYVGDHHQLDFAARMGDGRPGRFWLTAWADLRSTKLVGFALVEKPSTDSVLASFAAAAKSHGCPRQACMDRGKDFESKEIAGATKARRRRPKPFGKPEIDEDWVAPIMAELGVECHYSIPFNARAKPIERSFGTLAARFSKLWPSYLGPNTVEKPETARACWKDAASLPDCGAVLAALGEFAAAENARVRLGGRLKGLSADAAFEKFRGDLRPVREDLLPVLAMRTGQTQKVKRNGVSILGGLWYWNETLTVEHLGREVVVRYNPGDLSSIYVFDLEGRLLVEVERSELADVSRQDVGRAMARQRRTKKLLRERYAPRPVDWKYSVGKAAPSPTRPAPSSVPPGGRGFDMATLDQELMTGLEAQTG